MNHNIYEQNSDVVKIIHSYFVLKHLEDKSEYSGNVDFLMSAYPKEVFEVCQYVYENCIPKGDFNV